MKAIHSMIAALGPAFVCPAPADAGQFDPEVIIYRFPGVKDDGGANLVGVATVINCTNFSGATEVIRYVVRDDESAIRFNSTALVIHLTTVAAVTHTNAAYTGGNMSTGFINTGTIAIAATSINIICTAMVLDAANSKPTGVALRGIRFSPIPGSQE